MPVLRYSGQCIELSDAGFLLDGDDWTPATAEALAERHGVGPLNGRQWRLIALCREEAARGKECPTLERILELAELDAPAVDEMFAGEARRILAALAGLAGPLCRRSS